MRTFAGFVVARPLANGVAPASPSPGSPESLAVQRDAQAQARGVG